MANETVDVTNPAQMLGSLWMWVEDGVLYECNGLESALAAYRATQTKEPRDE